MTDSYAPIALKLNHMIKGGDLDHWEIFTQQVDQDVPKWLQQMLDHAQMPWGLAQSESQLPQHSWLIQDTSRPLFITQLIDVKDGQAQSLFDA